ncbi:MAG TPA: Ig-like domain-containing protein [bacterium]
MLAGLVWACCWSASPDTGLAADADRDLSARLNQLTLDVRHAAANLRQATGAIRQDAAARLDEVVRARYAIAQTALDAAPRALFESALTPAERAAMPGTLRALIEEPIEVEGTLHRRPGAPGSCPFELRDRRGRRWRLACAGDASMLVDGASVSIEGLVLDDRLLVRFDGAPPAFRAAPGSGDAAPPIVSIVEPSLGAVVRGRIDVAIDAKDHVGVAEVRLLKDGSHVDVTRRTPYRIRWDTRADPDGPHQLIAQAVDAAFNVGASPPVTITIDNTPPRVRLISPEPAATLSGTVTLAAQAEDAVGLQLVKFLLDGQALGLAVSPPYGLTWDTTTGPNGRHMLQALAVDHAGNTALSDPVSVLILNDNAAPLLDPIDDRTVPEGVMLSFRIQAHDPDGPRDPLTLRMTGLPPWAAFDAETGWVRGMPEFTVASLERPEVVSEPVRIEACDPQPLCAHREFSLTVEDVNRPPVLRIDARHTAVEGELFEAVAGVTDPDGDPVECRARGLPGWLAFDPARCAFLGVPAFDLASRDRNERSSGGIELSACDPGGACAQAGFAVVVTDRGRPPELDFLGGQTVDETDLLELAVTARDPDDERLVLRAEPLPKGARWMDHGNGTATLSWTPRADQGGNYTVLITASDGTFTVSETVPIQIRNSTLAVSGTVIEFGGSPLSGVSIAVTRTNERVTEALTGPDGRYILADLEPGTYTLRPSRSAGNAPTRHITYFDPLSRRIELGQTDIRDADFTANVRQ